MGSARVIPILSVAASGRPPRQALRRWAQAGFFVLFVLAPVFNLLRFDLVAGHAWLLGFEWHAGLEDFSRGGIDAPGVVLRVIGRVLLPILGVGALLIWVAWRWGRLYCGWLCPHFSVVETINACMRRATGRPSLWESRPLPPREPDGTPVHYGRAWWLVTVPLAVGFAFVWAVVLLTYLLPPFQVYGHLLAGTPTRNEFIFIGAGTLVLSAEFLFARHLFAATPAPSACSRVWPGWATAPRWWWVSPGTGRRTAQAATAPATTSAPCASSRATSSVPCSLAPSAPNASALAKPPSGTIRRGRCCDG